MAGSKQNTEDLELIRRVRQGVPDAFLQLSTRYVNLLGTRAAAFEGPSAPERDDLLQEGLVGLYLAAMTYDESRGASFRTYAGVCIRNHMADAARRHASKRNRPLNESLSLDGESAAQIPLGTGPEDQLELRERARALLARIEEVLSPLERQALGLYLSGRPREEIEARSGMTLKAYDNALYRVRRKLKEQLEF